jgi:hypothetical protein
MFFMASSFDQDLSIWDVSKRTKITSMFKHANILYQRLRDSINQSSFFDGEYLMMPREERHQCIAAAFHWTRRKNFLIYLVSRGFLYSECASKLYYRQVNKATSSLCETTLDIADLSRFICKFL